MPHLILILALIAIPASAANKPEFDAAKYVKTCKADWSKYNEELDKLRAASIPWLKDLSEAEFDKLEDANDPLITFISFTWPAILEKQIPTWRVFADCADRHLRLLRLQMADRSRKHAEDIEAWSDCVTAVASAGKQPLPPPLKELEACYQAQAVKFKD